MNTTASAAQHTAGPTPETDAKVRVREIRDLNSLYTVEEVDADFARKLERQRDEAKRDADLMRPFDETQVDKIIAERDALLAQRDELLAALEKCLAFQEGLTNPGNPECVVAARTAIRSVKP